MPPNDLDHVAAEMQDVTLRNVSHARGRVASTHRVIDDLQAARTPVLRAAG